MDNENIENENDRTMDKSSEVQNISESEIESEIIFCDAITND